MTTAQLNPAARLERSTSPDALAYLDFWIHQPVTAAPTDAQYQRWERDFDRLATDAEAGISAALEALDVIDADVTATIRRHRNGRPESP